MPQYNLGHLDASRRSAHKLAKYSRLYFAGVAYDGIGIPDCIHAAETTATAGSTPWPTLSARRPPEAYWFPGLSAIR